MSYAKLKNINPCYQTFGVVRKPIICDPILRDLEPVSTERVWITEKYEPSVTVPYTNTVAKNYNEWIKSTNSIPEESLIPVQPFRPQDDAGLACGGMRCGFKPDCTNGASVRNISLNPDDPTSCYEFCAIENPNGSLSHASIAAQNVGFQPGVSLLWPLSPNTRPPNFQHYEKPYWEKCKTLFNNAHYDYYVDPKYPKANYMVDARLSSPGKCPYYDQAGIINENIDCNTHHYI